MLKWTFICIVLAGTMGCDKLDRPEVTPSYLDIAKFSLTTDAGVEGENTELIVDAWVYMDNQLLGVFELPARVPILADGEHSFDIRPGIKNNGISETRRIYPFYKPFEANITLFKDSVIDISPSTTYKVEAQFSPNPEGFESAGQVIIADNTSDTGWVVGTSGITGNYGRIVLDGVKDYAYFRTDDNHNFPKLGEEVYLEMDIKSNNPIVFGVIDENITTPAKVYNVYGVNATNQSGLAVWKKIYMSLTDVLSYESQATQHEFFIEVYKNADVSTVDVCIDNIKIVHF